MQFLCLWHSLRAPYRFTQKPQDTQSLLRTAGLANGNRLTSSLFIFLFFLRFLLTSSCPLLWVRIPLSSSASCLFLSSLSLTSLSPTVSSSCHCYVLLSCAFSSLLPVFLPLVPPYFSLFLPLFSFISIFLFHCFLPILCLLSLFILVLTHIIQALKTSKLWTKRGCQVVQKYTFRIWYTLSRRSPCVAASSAEFAAVPICP